MKNTIETGAKAEAFACVFLKKRGLKLIHKNFRCKMGEIDLIMQDKETLVFIEVRLRNNPHFGAGEESVTFYKQQKIAKAAAYYLLSQKNQTTPYCRFDVLALARHNTSYKTHWIQDAFYAEGTS